MSLYLVLELRYFLGAMVEGLSVNLGSGEDIYSSHMDHVKKGTQIKPAGERAMSDALEKRLFEVCF